MKDDAFLCTDDPLTGMFTAEEIAERIVNTYVTIDSSTVIREFHLEGWTVYIKKQLDFRLTVGRAQGEHFNRYDSKTKHNP